MFGKPVVERAEKIEQKNTTSTKERVPYIRFYHTKSNFAARAEDLAEKEGFPLREGFPFLVGNDYLIPLRRNKYNVYLLGVREAYKGWDPKNRRSLWTRSQEIAGERGLGFIVSFAGVIVFKSGDVYPFLLEVSGGKAKSLSKVELEKSTGPYGFDLRRLRTKNGMNLVVVDFVPADKIEVADKEAAQTAGEKAMKVWNHVWDLRKAEMM